ncbi:MAG: hypothetical protein JNK04_18815 [Myxococcales bacterium]|nr:hypothetical protein [Myxococcales bacterium]
MSASAAPTSAPIAVPPLYAELFREGTKLELRVETRHWAEGKTKHGAVRASCVVARVVAIAEGRRSQVACTGMPDVDIPDPLSGTWTFTEAGLFHNSPQPDGTSSIVLDDGHLVFGPGPQPTEKKKETAQAEGGWTLKVEKKGEAWCSSRDYSGGDPAWTSICVAEGSGVRSGKWGWTGGTTHEAELSRER